jgi:uncharacterized protein DUF5666
MTTTIHTRRHAPTNLTRAAAAAACLALGLGVSACGSSPAADTPAANQGEGQPDGTTPNGGTGGAPGAGMGGPGGSGKVAAVSGSTAQVQGQGAQVAVTWTSKTAFTRQVSASAGDLEVGDCVLAMPAMDATPDSSGSTTEVAAATVRISPAVDGSCTNGMRGPGGGPQQDQGGAPPQGAPGGSDQDAPQGGDGQARRGGFGAIGKVTAVDGTAFTVESVQPGSSDTSSVRVSTSSDTAWTRTAKATSKDVKVGRCVTSIGRTDSTGAITAASIAVSEPVDGECGAMFGRGPGGGAPGGTGNGDDEGAQDS